MSLSMCVCLPLILNAVSVCEICAGEMLAYSINESLCGSNIKADVI